MLTYAAPQQLLEKAMRECGMNKAVPADKIAGGSFPENLALLQFLHTYIQRNCPGNFFFVGASRNKSRRKRTSDSMISWQNTYY